MPARILAFFRSDVAGGVVLMAAAAIAVLWANSPLSSSYFALWHLPVGANVGPLVARADLHFLVNDALMAVFFLLVGLELRREATTGQLNSIQRAAAPAVGAIGGMVVPAAIYLALTAHDKAARDGWAIPTATDIAFSLAVLRLLGPRVPGVLRIFLTALAVIDDLGAILIIAFFFTEGLDVLMLGGAAAAWLAMFAANRLGLRGLSAYVAGFVVLWVFLVQSGVHATLAGVATAMAVPMRTVGHRMEHALHVWVAFLVLPLFALANAGLPLGAIHLGMVRDPIVPAIILGLLVGKPLGVLGLTWIAAKLRLIRLPSGLDWALVAGAATLCGIGFTMSLFIGLLAFPDGDRTTELKFAVFVASIAAALLGAFLVARATRPVGGAPPTVASR